MPMPGSKTLQNMGMREMVKHGKVLTNQLKSIDESIKALQKAFNNNMMYFDEKLKKIEKAVEELKDD